MTQGHEEIVVFRQFDNFIDANIAKSKLDAYGIPCFLTEENMAMLYQQALAIRIRLHIFKKDIDEASGILMVSSESVTDDLVCPKCNSAEVERDFPKKLSDEPLTALKLLFFGVFLPHKKINHCLQCDNEF